MPTNIFLDSYQDHLTVTEKQHMSLRPKLSEQDDRIFLKTLGQNEMDATEIAQFVNIPSVDDVIGSISRLHQNHLIPNPLPKPLTKDHKIHFYRSCSEIKDAIGSKYCNYLKSSDS
ncbi:hypothetical protein [Neisseria shayeganii]|uniref:Uncharacterized protein n=1 Tax=Neisseria shayeganii TaxID=607712 RepID=A0A7D7N2S8_9NEIS|nr:hypothetical protein [Neisseria shayeganii]QMT39985.1 hypothetical protein H3L94_09015 [Neisseria shayeganii]